MSGSVEHADGTRGLGTFPSHWGLPEGRSGTEERTSWILRNIGTDQGLRRRGLQPVEPRRAHRPGASARLALTKALAALN